MWFMDDNIKAFQKAQVQFVHFDSSTWSNDPFTFIPFNPFASINPFDSYTFIHFNLGPIYLQFPLITPTLIPT